MGSCARLVVFLVVFVLSSGICAAQDGMPHMPRVQPKRIFTVSDREAGQALLLERGFGDQEPSVRMMNLMMVEGSGMEGMKMAANDPPKSMQSSASSGVYAYQPKITPDPPKVGSNVLEILIQNKATGKPIRGLKLKAKVSMMSMDMGTEDPPVREAAPGKYRVVVSFSMRGPWAVEITLSSGESEVFNFEAGKSAH